MTHNIEVNIFDFDQDIYGSIIRVNFINFIRGDEKFSSLDALKVQLAEDDKAARAILVQKA